MKAVPTERMNRPQTNPFIACMLFAIALATWNTFISCHSNPHPHVWIIERNETPKVNLNTATATELMTLPGIGSIKSIKIIEGRPYRRISELWHIEGIGQKTMSNIQHKVIVD